jgi:hypothetical protein
MPLVTVTPGNFDDLISTTLQLYAPRVEDNFYNALAHWHLLNKSGAVKMYSGGESFVIPVLFADNNTAKRMLTGYDEISVEPQSNVTAAQYLPRQYCVSVTISRKEELANSDEARAIDLLQTKVESAELAERNLLNGDAVAATATAGAVTALGEAFEANVQASQANTIGGISKATYDWWRHQYATASSAFGTNGRVQMATLYNLCSGGSSDHPTMICCDRASYENFERTIEPSERLTPGAGQTGDPRFELLKFRGALLYFDPALVTTTGNGKMYFLNPRYYFLKVHTKDHFYVTPWTKFPSQTAGVAQISWTGQIIISNMRRMGVLDDTETF